MKRIFAATMLVIMSILCWQQTAAQQTASAPSRASWGRMIGHTYVNDVIGIKLTLPKTFDFSEPNRVPVNFVIQAPGSRFDKRTLVSQSIITASGPNVEQLICMAIKLPAADASMTAEQMLNDRWFRTADGPTAQTEKLSKNTFAFVDTPNRFTKIRNYAIVRRGHYVQCTTIRKTDEDFEVLRKILGEADFDWKGK